MTQLNTALFIDYDNVASELEQEDQRTAAKFGSDPLRWLDRMRTSLPFYADADYEVRRIVARRCYASPRRIERYRRTFTLAGFEVIDCPPLTSQLKNSADIYIVMDIIDYMSAYPHIDEYVILSADADFTPVLNRLRRYLKRTVIFGTYKTAAAYRSCSDSVISPEFFSDTLSAPAAPARVRDAPVEPLEEAPVLTLIASTKQLDEDVAAAVEDAVFEVVRTRNGLAPFSAIAPAIPPRLGDRLAGKWGGFGSFTSLLKALSPTKVRFDWEREVAFIPDFVPDLSTWSDEEREGLGEFVTDVIRLYNIPLLRPADYTFMLDKLAEYWKEPGGTIVSAINFVVEQCQAKGIVITLASVRFIVRGIMLQGVEYGPEVTTCQLAEAFRRNVFHVCDEPEWMAERDEAARLVYWIRADEEGEDAVDTFLSSISELVPESPDGIEVAASGG